MLKYSLTSLAFAVCMQGAAFAASGETAQADKARKKPLQRCDQLSDKAQLDCLEKARERIVEARRKRVSSGEAGEAKEKPAAEGQDIAAQKKAAPGK